MIRINLLANKGIHIDWTKNIKDPSKKEEFVKMLTSSLALRRLKDLLKEREASQERQETTQDDYDNPSWAYKQADRNGYRRCLKMLNELLNFIED